MSFSTGYIDLLSGARIDINLVDTLKSTYAQTIDRNMFASVGVGTPPFNISMYSPYRSTGFMSETTLFRPPAGEQKETSVFKSCKTIKQCFVDRFTYNGRTVKRQVLDPATSTMRDWAGIDGQNCGVFGIWVGSGDKAAFNRLCPGEDWNTRFCCYMDASAAPLFYMFHYHWDNPIVQKVRDTCDGITSPIQTHLSNMGAFYTTSKVNTLERTQRLSSIKSRLNQILDEFTPGARTSPRTPMGSATEYLRTTDCSVELYKALQAFAGCADGTEGSTPFCTSYAVEDKQRYGVHYFLDYTMAEVPFAWWHKCMLLQGRTFAIELASSSSSSRSSSGFIQCDEWKTSAIPISSASSASSESANDMLTRIDGGITTAMINNSITDLKIELQKIVRTYIKSGFSSPLDQGNTLAALEDTRFLHRGAPGEYNMRCYSKTSMAQLGNFIALSKDDGSKQYDCIQDTLWWMRSDNYSLKAWGWGPDGENPFSSTGSRGINPACYDLKEKDTTSITNAGRSASVYRFIENLTVSKPSTDDGIILSEKLAPLFRSIKLHDFLSSATTTTATSSESAAGPSNKFLAAELWVPDAPDDIKADVMQSFRVKDLMLTGVLDPLKTTPDFWKTVSQVRADGEFLQTEKTSPNSYCRPL
jgi:hypothetical protein